VERQNQAGMARNENVVNCLYPKRDAIFKLICFPWAGGSSNYFAKWGQTIHDSVEVHSIRLAGRESRWNEPFASDPDQLIEEIVCALLPVLQDKPFAFFGHSMGSYTALLTALQLKNKHKLEPIHLFLSSAVIPREKNSQVIKLEHMAEEQTKSFLVTFGGTPKDLIDKEFIQQVSPKLKADGHIFQKYNFDSLPFLPTISCDLSCFWGSEDIVKDMKGWKEITSGNLHAHVLPGDHFYFMETSNENFIKDYITKCLELSMLVSV
uniref:S-acyl fatty acid synthase thioesterase, medium chain n=2 Tax=Rhinolophus ferrumequinum TaxID=59479 RepID=A0A671G170_RHIFE